MKNKLILIVFLLISLQVFSQNSELLVDTMGRQGIEEYPNVVNLYVDDKPLGAIEVWETGLYVNNLREGVFESYTKRNKKGQFVAHEIYVHDTVIISIYYLHNKIRTIMKWKTLGKFVASDVSFTSIAEEIFYYNKNGTIKIRKKLKNNGTY